MMTDVTQTATELQNILKSGVKSLPDGQIEFANSLCYQALNKSKPLSEKQREWLFKLYSKALTGPPPPKVVDLGVSMMGLISLFDGVASKLKNPKIPV